MPKEIEYDTVLTTGKTHHQIHDIIEEKGKKGWEFVGMVPEGILFKGVSYVPGEEGQALAKQHIQEIDILVSKQTLVDIATNKLLDWIQEEINCEVDPDLYNLADKVATAMGERNLSKKDEGDGKT